MQKANTKGGNRFQHFERLGPCLYQRGNKIYARVRMNGKQTWLSTETDNPKEARAWLTKWRKEKWMLRNGIEPQGVTLHRERVTVAEILEEYCKADCPTRKGKQKYPETVKNELRYIRPIRQYFGDTPAASLILGHCDKYRDWRTSGGYVSTFKLRGHDKTKTTTGGNRMVDCELQTLSNALNLAVRRDLLKANPIVGRGKYTSEEDVRHCREVAPTPEGLQKIIGWLRGRNEKAVADLVEFLAYSGLRIGEALSLRWDAVNLGEGILQVKREKKGVNPWVAILPEMEVLLRNMETCRTSNLLFPSPFNAEMPRDHAAIRHRLTTACQEVHIGHVTPHGLRSYFVTQARQSGLTDAEIAMLIGDKSGPSIIAHTYGDLRPDHLLAQAQRIRLSVSVCSNNCSNVSLPVATGLSE